ncbi:hypothetical protein ASG88_10615 [Nocardioides sp. Soil777]|nr:hypothetical protein ASG88_10615 [Nocardioides sp. Soil777]
MVVSREVLTSMRDRPVGRVWLAVDESRGITSFDDASRAVGLRPLSDSWVVVDAERAARIITGLLHRDLAYNAEIMPLLPAQALAAEFVSAFGPHVQCATNTEGLPHESPKAWAPATDATFDSGVAILGDSVAGIYWVADED